MLVAAVRRVRQPGAKFDEMLVLQSPQGFDKSGAMKALAGGDRWFADDLPLTADAKRVIEMISGKWIVEAAELNGIRKGEVEHLKSMLSRTHDRARLAYGRLTEERPRRCIFVGTSNSHRFLRDLTGNRRFWPVRVDRFDIEAILRDRDQLRAEAAAREADGGSIRLDPSLWAEAAEEQEARRVEDPIYERLQSVFGDDLCGKVRSDDVWRVLGKQQGLGSQGDNGRIGDAMRRLGFEKDRLRFGGPSPEYCYTRGEKPYAKIVLRFDEFGGFTRLETEP